MKEHIYKDFRCPEEILFAWLALNKMIYLSILFQRITLVSWKQLKDQLTAELMEILTTGPRNPSWTPSVEDSCSVGQLSGITYVQILVS